MGIMSTCQLDKKSMLKNCDDSVNKPNTILPV